jgi:hypothetical protein
MNVVLRKSRKLIGTLTGTASTGDVPEKFGGAGLGMLDMSVLLEECGYAALPGPSLFSSVLAASALDTVESVKRFSGLGAPALSARTVCGESPRSRLRSAIFASRRRWRLSLVCLRPGAVRTTAAATDYAAPIVEPP